MSKLDDLCAIKVMNWHKEFFMYLDADDNDAVKIDEWSPSTSLDDALVCLERAAKGNWWEIRKDVYGIYSCDMGCTDGTGQEAKTAALAICKMCLRAMGVPESEISLAMEI